MRDVAIGVGIMSREVPEDCKHGDFATHWYHLMVGRPVPYRVGGATFFDVPLFHCMAPEAKGRVGKRPSFGTGVVTKYQRVLRPAQGFVTTVLSRTQTVFGVQWRRLDRHLGRAAGPPVQDPQPLAGPEEEARQQARRDLRVQARAAASSSGTSAFPFLP